MFWVQFNLRLRTHLGARKVYSVHFAPQTLACFPSASCLRQQHSFGSLRLDLDLTLLVLVLSGRGGDDASGTVPLLGDGVLFQAMKPRLDGTQPCSNQN